MLPHFVPKCGAKIPLYLQKNTIILGFKIHLLESMQKINTLFREARESRGLTTKDAAKALKVKERHIQMLEDGEMAELSREIYLKGLLKTYSTWLNLDGVDVISKVKSEKKYTPRRNPVAVTPINVSYLSLISRSPGLIIFLLSALIVLVIYVFWYSNHKTNTHIDMVTSIEKTAEPQVNVKYTNIQEPYLNRDMVFFPHADVEIKILDTASGQEKSNSLSDGDVFFYKTDEASVITATSPQAIEVFIDNNGEQEPVGTLDKVLISF